MNKLQIRHSLLLLLTSLIWGTAFVAQSEGMDYVGPLTFNCVRSLLGGAVLIPCIWFLGKINNTRELKNGMHSGSDSKKNSHKLWTGGITCGILLCLASNFQQFGIAYTTVGKAGFITACYIIIVPVLGLFFHKKCGAAIWIGVLLSLAGLYFLCINDASALEVTERIFPAIPVGKGDFLVFICAVLFSVHILVIDYFSGYVDGVKMSCIQFFVCGILSGIGMFVTEEPHMTEILEAWLPIAYAGILSCGVGYTLQIVGQKGMNPTVASLLLSLESVFSVLAGMAVLGQKPTMREAVGCVLMFTAIILVQIPWKGRKKEYI